jgi:murein DD-endopeptidase MepM/ murein hydrolase activator NlpD
MAEQNYTQFLASDIHGAISFANGFSQFISRILIPALNESQDTIQIGGTEYPTTAAVHYFGDFLLSNEPNGFRRRYLPNLEKLDPKFTQELIGKLKVIRPYIKIDPDDSGSSSMTVSRLREVIALYGEYAAMGQQGGEQDNTEAITQAVASLSSSIGETIQQAEELFKHVSVPHLLSDDKALEDIPDADKDLPEDKEEGKEGILKEKKERRDKRSQKLQDFRKKTEDLVRTQKEQNKIDSSTLAGKIYTAVEKEEQKSEKIEAILVKLLAVMAKSTPQDGANQTYLWTQDQLKQAIALLRTFIEALNKEFKKLQEETAKDLRLIVPVASAGVGPQDQGGMETAEDEEPQTSKAIPQDINNEQNQKARAVIRDKWLAEIEKIVSALNPPRISDLYLALNLGREIDAPEKQTKDITAYIVLVQKDVTELHDEYSQAAELAADGKEIEPELTPPTAQNFDQHIERIVRAKLLDAWKTLLEEETPEQQKTNVPVGAIADAKKQQEAAAQAATVAATESEQSLSDKIARISRVQHDMLLVAEGELRLKLKSLGLQDPQIEKIISDNRTLLLDTIRYKAFALAGDLPADKRVGSSQIVGVISNEVESFYQKLVVTYSDASAQPQMAGYFAKADTRTQNNIRSGLQALGWSENEIYDVISNLEQSRFAPLVEFARANGYLSGASGLAGVLVKHNLVHAEQAASMAKRLANGDLSALIEPALNGLQPAERKEVIQKLLSILEKKQRGGTLSADEQSTFNRYITSLLGPENGPAVVGFMSRLTFADLHQQMSQLHGILAAADAGGDLGGRRGMAAPLVAFSGRGGASAAVEAPVEEGMSDRDKFMLEVGLAEAYRRIAEAEGRGDNTALIEVEISLLVHQFTTKGSSKGLTAKFYGDVDGGEDGLNNVAQEAGINTDQLSNARQKSYKQRAATGQAAGAQEKMAQAQLAAKLLRTGGNPAAIAATLLTDAQARKLIIDRLKKMAVPLGIAAGGIIAAPAIVAALIYNAVTQFLANLPLIGGMFGSLFGINAASGVAGSSSAVGGVTQELGRSAVSAGRDAATAGKSQFARAKPGLESGAKSAIGGTTQTATQMVYNINASMAPGWLAGMAILGPFTMASFFTIIVITVIGGSLGGLPTDNPFFANNSGSVDTLGIEACWPAEGAISTYVHPANRLSTGGTAIDIAKRPIGSPVYTPFGGRAKFISSTGSYAGGYGAYGKYVRVTTDKGFDIILAHLSAFSGASNGDTITVVAGQQIGRMGSTGNSDGPHVHYEVLPTAGRGRAPAIYSVTPPVYPATTLSPIQIDQRGGFSARFADCASGQIGQPGSFSPTSTGGGAAPATNTQGTPATNNGNVNGTLPAGNTVPTQSQLDAILNAAPPTTGGN